MLSLRPVAQHAPLRRAAAMHGARVLALSPWRLQALDDDATRADLRAALACDRVVFTSPAAVRAAARLQELDAALTASGVPDDDRAFNLSWHDWINLRNLITVSRTIAAVVSRSFHSVSGR